MKNNVNTIPENLTAEKFLEQLKEKYGERDERKKAFEVESPTVAKYFRTVSRRLSNTYKIEKVLAVGGTGIVLAGHHSRFEQPIVVKINRPGASAVEHEAEILPTLSHPNIIPVLDLAILCVHADRICDCKHPDEPCEHDKEEPCESTQKLTYIVEPFIKGSKPFFTHDPERVGDTWLRGQTKALKDLMPDNPQLGRVEDSIKATGLINSLLGEVTRLFSEWADFLNAMNLKGYVYLDVKPENVLVDGHGHLTSIDYGSAEKLNSTDHSPVKVYFTKHYAHPRPLEEVDLKPSSNRVTSGMQRSDLRAAFDYFALGISMLEILNEIATVRPHVVPQLPRYRSLHFLATRLLDDKNLKGTSFPYASCVFPGLQATDYEKLSYENLKEVLRDLDKERGRWNLESEVPELATYSKDIVRIVPGFNTVITSRLKRLIAHPLVGRLKYVSQLGLVTLVYPTADHARYDHALGSYTYTSYYIKALFNDLGNPLFRNLVGKADIHTVLLAALLHDLGQYPLAHDLEEVHGGIFMHADVGTDLLLDEEVVDEDGRTLAAIIEHPEDGWNVEIESLIKVLGLHTKTMLRKEKKAAAGDIQETALEKKTTTDKKATLKSNILAAIVDGQIDADKADYIIRDSSRCELPYGAQLDMERLLRVLTVAIIPTETKLERRVALGVYDKGLVSAHAVGLARYELLSTVYWHHTARIIKAMLQFATAFGLPDEVFDSEDVREGMSLQIRTSLLTFIKSLVPPFTVPKQPKSSEKASAEEGLDMAAQPPKDIMTAVADVRATTEENVDTWYPGIAWTDWLMLEWIAGLPNASVESRNLIKGIQKRRLYKRVATLSRKNHLPLISRLDRLSWRSKRDLCQKLHKSVFDTISTEWDRLDTVTNMSQSAFEKLAEVNFLVIVDIPSATSKIGFTRPLGVVPELKEKTYQQQTAQAREDESWREIMAKMIEGIAPVRVLCHPDIRNLIGSLYVTPETPSVETAMADLINEKLKELKL